MRGFHFHLRRTTKRMLYACLLFVAALTLSTSRAPGTLEVIQNRGVLRIITIPGSTTYFEDGKGKAGFEYLLTKAFARHLGVKLEISVMESVNSALIAVGTPVGDFAAAGLTITPERKKRFRFSIPYHHTSELLIYRQGERRPTSVADLRNGRLLVLKGSSHLERLQQLKQQYENLSWEELDEDMLRLMQLVHEGETDFAIVDANAYRVDRSIYPKAKAAFDISPPQPLGWVFPQNGDGSLLKAANQFLKEYEKSGKLSKLWDQFLGHTKKFSVAGSQLFMSRMNSRLPKYQGMFKETADKYAIDWLLLAAISYQESHWNPKAKSPTGVRGLMMLTLSTAKEMGVKKRLDPEQSLDGGARYFLKAKERIPSQIKEPDRTWFALAAYNIGLGHLEDARVLTDRAGKNPNLWSDVSEHLPLLQQKKFYSTVRHGYARGKEPVQYVQNIRHYYDILKLHIRESEKRQERERMIDLPSSSNLGSDSLLSL
ncbi:MAG: membrane-bound lytic murein transglycosylase MltF [Pseudomonadales bacterium]|nr:membrane-bound lytic murein transglycosylase MltF [Pseudomonadales bacterium]MCP5171345.1 membrane-bound lytic murein transglycosylase MltF [Pseudomonadales bacterium]